MSAKMKHILKVVIVTVMAAVLLCVVLPLCGVLPLHGSLRWGISVQTETEAPQFIRISGRAEAEAPQFIQLSVIEKVAGLCVPVQEGTGSFVLESSRGIVLEDSCAFRPGEPLDVDSIQYAAGRFRFVYDQYIADHNMKVFFSVIPEKNYYMKGKRGYSPAGFESVVSELGSRMDFAEYIGIAQLLELDDYYRTDAHWRQEKIVDIAQYLAARMGVSLTADYRIHQVDVPFFGTYFRQSALPMVPDRMYYLDSDALQACSVYDFETDTQIPLYDLEKTKGDNLYEIFLSGPKSLLTVENPDACTDRELILFRDSFGSSIAPLLAEGYRKITLVDIRYLSPQLLGRWIEFSGQDVLFLYSTSVLNNSVTIK